MKVTWLEFNEVVRGLRVLADNAENPAEREYVQAKINETVNMLDVDGLQSLVESAVYGDKIIKCGGVVFTESEFLEAKKAVSFDKIIDAFKNM